MKIYIKTTITPRIKVYDSEAEKSKFSIFKFLQPSLAIYDNNETLLFDYGETKNDYFFVLLLAFGLLFGIIFLRKK